MTYQHNYTTYFHKQNLGGNHTDEDGRGHHHLLHYVCCSFSASFQLTQILCNGEGMDAQFNLGP